MNVMHERIGCENQEVHLTSGLQQSDATTPIQLVLATRCLWAGVDLRTVQQWLGHSDMESTMRYLKPSRSQHVRDKVNEIFG